MQSADYIEKLKYLYGDNLEKLDPLDRYGLISFLAFALNRQMYPVAVMAQHEDIFGLLVPTEVRGTFYHCPPLLLPNVIKFLSESLPASW